MNKNLCFMLSTLMVFGEFFIISINELIRREVQMVRIIRIGLRYTFFHPLLCYTCKQLLPQQLFSARGKLEGGREREANVSEMDDFNCCSTSHSLAPQPPPKNKHHPQPTLKKKDEHGEREILKRNGEEVGKNNVEMKNGGKSVMGTRGEALERVAVPTDVGALIVDIEVRWRAKKVFKSSLPVPFFTPTSLTRCLDFSHCKLGFYSV